MSEIRLAGGRRFVVCDVCLAHVDDADPVTGTWHRAMPCRPGGPDRCPDCAIPPRAIAVAAPFVPA